jgi:hypothetical protein
MPLLIAPNGAVFSPLTPADARSSEHAVAVGVLRDGNYRVMLLGGADDATGDVTFRATSDSRKLPFSHGGAQSLASAQVTTSVGFGLGYAKMGAAW